MDFSYDETHLAVKQAATDVLDSAVPEAVWKALGQAGLLSLGRPESLGGDGLGMVDTGIVLTEIGRRALITPAFPALPLDLALTRSGHSALLPPDSFLTYALAPPLPPPASSLAPSDLVSRPPVASSPVSFAPSGSAADSDPVEVAVSFVPSGSAADSEDAAVSPAAAVGTWRGGVPAGFTVAGVPFGAEAGGVMLLNAGEAVAAKVTATEAGYSSSGIPEYTVTLDATGPSLEADCYPYLLAGAAALADGLLAGALTLTTEHLRTREQFGKPLATFQIAAALIADVYIASRTMHLIALSLAWGLDTGRDVTADVEAAEHWLRTEAVGALRTCHHLHGGIGLDVTYPLHRYYSLMKDLVRYVHRPH